MQTNTNSTRSQKPANESFDSRKERGYIEHRVKSWPQFFEQTIAGNKTHDLRQCDDRNFHVGDFLYLQEFDPKAEKYTGRELRMKITYITSADVPCALSEYALHPNYCILSIQKS